jgi:hypothetical protein
VTILLKGVGGIGYIVDERSRICIINEWSFRDNSPNIAEGSGNVVGKLQENTTNANNYAIYAAKVVNIVNFKVDIIDLPVYKYHDRRIYLYLHA